MKVTELEDLKNRNEWEIANDIIERVSNMQIDLENLLIGKRAKISTIKKKAMEIKELSNILYLKIREKSTDNKRSEGNRLTDGNHLIDKLIIKAKRKIYFAEMKKKIKLQKLRDGKNK